MCRCSRGSAVPASAAEGLDGGRRFALFEDVDPARLEQVGRQREVETARRAACLPHHLDASRQVVVALFSIDHEVSSGITTAGLLGLFDRTLT